MNRAARRMALLERRPWTLALISAAGVTLLIPSVLALYGPPELLDSAVALGDNRLALGLAGLFAVSAGILRLLPAARIREAKAGIVVAPDDVDGIQYALEKLVDQWRSGELADVSLPPALIERISRRTRTRQLAELLQSIKLQSARPQGA